MFQFEKLLTVPVQNGEQESKKNGHWLRHYVHSRNIGSLCGTVQWKPSAAGKCQQPVTAGEKGKNEQVDENERMSESEWKREWVKERVRMKVSES